MAAIINQRGMGTISSPGARAGGAANLMGSRSFTYSVPMFSLPGRHGLNLNLVLYYNSLLWESVVNNGVTYNPELSSPSVGFRLDYGYIAWSDGGIGTSGVLVDATGAKHPLVGPPFGSQFNTADSSYISVSHHFGTSSTDLDSDVVTYKNGTQTVYQEAPGSAFTCCPGSIAPAVTTLITRPVKTEDASGNFITINYSDSSSTQISSVTDTVGRTVTFIYDNGLLNCVTDGTTCTSVGSRTFTFSWNTGYILNYNFNFMITGIGSVIPPLQGASFPYTVLSGVTRPDGTKVQFNYGDWMIVNDIQELSNNGTLRYESTYNFPAASAGPLSDPPTYTQQIVTTFDKDSKPKQATWLYQSVTSTPTPSTKIVSCFAVTDPAGTSHITTLSAQGNIFDGLPIKTITATGSTAPCTNPPVTILQTLNTQWTSDTDSGGNLTGINPRVLSKTTILNDGKTQSQTQVAGYDVHGNPTDVKQFDFGSGSPGPLLRETVTTYALNLGNIFNRPTDVQVKDGGGNILRHETFVYDNYSQTPLQAITPLPPGFDTSSTFSPTSSISRGNLTGTTVYTNAAAGTGPISTAIAYDVLGNPLSIQAGCCTQAAAAYSSNTQYAYPDSVSDGPQGGQLTTRFTYNLSNGRIATITDANGQKTQTSYDMDNRAANTTTPDGITTIYSYDDASEKRSISLSNTANGLVVKAASDFLGRVLSRQVLNGSSLVSTTSYINDVLGRAAQISNPYAPGDTALYKSYVFDPLGRTTAVIPPALAGATQNSYKTSYNAVTFTDATGISHVGITIQTTDPAGHSRLEYRNALGYLVRLDELNPAPQTNPYSTYYSYDALGNLLQVTQGQQTRTYSYDSIGRKTSSCLPETNNKCTSFTYTDFNAIKTKVDSRNVTTTYGFDLLNRVNDIQYSDGTPRVTFTYGGTGAPNNSNGHLVSTTDGTGSKTYQYDVMGRPTTVAQVIGGNTYTTTFSYINGQLAAIKYPSTSSGAGTQANCNYDGIGRLSSVMVGGLSVYSVGSYNAAGQVLTSSFGSSNMAGSYSYNNQQQLASIQYANGTMPLVDITYAYGGFSDNGQIQGIADNLDSTHSTSYLYDGLGRLQQAQTVDQTSPASWNLQFSYDRYGNRLSETPVGGNASMPNSQLSVDPTTNHVISAGVAYDAAGNMISDSVFNYAFDAANRMTSVSAPGVGTPSATYSYDSLGDRVIKNGNVYVYVGGRVIAEYPNGAGPASPSVEHIYAGARRVATISNGVLTYHYWDHMSIRVSTDANGRPVRTYGSFPFGETWYETGVADKWKFTTYENDSESGLNFASARFHSPALGRFLSLDPFAGFLTNPQSFNRYAYVRNNPINSTDQTGMFCDMGCDDGDDGGGGGGGGAPCGPFECGGSSTPDPSPTPDPSTNDLPDAPEPKPEVLQAATEMSFVFNGGNSMPDFSGDFTDLSTLTPTVQSGSQTISGNSSGGDVAPGLDIWHTSPQCQGCGEIWRNADGAGKAAFIGTAGVLAAVPLAAEGALVAANLSAQAIGWYSGLTGGAGVVLGKFPEYLEAGEEMGANVFNLWDPLYNSLDRLGQSWTANQAFLDASIYRGQDFYVSSVEASGSYWMELQYLSNRGFGPETWKGAFIRF